MINIKPIRMGILGAAAIVPMALTGPVRSVSEIQVTAIAARDPKRAEKFARRHHIPRVHETYDDLLSDPEIDAVYNPLPNGLHAEWTIRALRAGKHVLCEKPFASNAKEAMEMASVARKTGKVLSEAFAYRTHPLAARLKEVMTNGEIGKIQKIETRFGFLNLNLFNIRYHYELAGGAQMDAGCYPVSLVRFLVGEEPTVTQAKARLVKPQVDSRMESQLNFPNGIQTNIVCDMLSPKLFDSFLRIQGDAGEMTVISPYQPHWFHLITVRNSKGVKRGRIQGENAYVSQLRAFSNAIRSQTPFTTNPEDAVNNMRVIDAIYEKAGLHLRGI
ncbi:MAG: Gfo/Idh/MocA family oxidoreductase [Anaerolineales bacterium]|nr:Gfo/Idh/MocA family oxidoreductase [Anaerolineales bacterium]